MSTMVPPRPEPIIGLASETRPAARLLEPEEVTALEAKAVDKNDKESRDG